MVTIDNLTDSADQNTQVVLADGSILALEFVFRPTTQRWTVNVSHPLLTVNGISLCVHPNILRSWRNLVPFGLGCSSSDGVDPFDVEDFADGRVTMYVLDQADVSGVEQVTFGGALQ
jgi:hypothetical protein